MNVKVEDLGNTKVMLEEMLSNLIADMASYPFGGMYMAPYVSYIREILRDMPKDGYVTEGTVRLWSDYLLGVSLHFAVKATTDSSGTNELYAVSSLRMAEDLLQYIEITQYLRSQLMMARAMKQCGYITP